ncbi:MAG: VCBS repeat-containing protein [Flavobacteriales bacterium]|nr:VCBS repeat-containing protein [Flavobacteriales bacterium]
MLNESLMTVTPGDFNNDGHIEYICGANMSPDLSNIIDGVFHLQSNNNLVLTDNQSFASGEYNSIDDEMLKPIMADLNGDGYLDLLSTGSITKWHPNIMTYGCMDPTACNYDPQAIVNSGCCFGECGCTDPDAMNYSSTADCNKQGSCFYLAGAIVFNDINFNGVLDGSDYGIAGQQLTIIPGNIDVITDSAGHFAVPLPPGDYVVSHVFDPLFPFYTTAPTQYMSLPDGNSNSVAIGVNIDQMNGNLEINIDDRELMCNAWRTHTVSVHNNGNYTMDGTTAITVDLNYQGWESNSQYLDSIIGNQLYFSFYNLLPGGTIHFHYLLWNPVAENIGEEIYTNVVVTGFYNGEPILTATAESAPTITCAYDPNDKLANPIGFTDAHYIEDNTEITYQIRFQNAGNATANNVYITDVIDENLNLSTFELSFHSHNVMTSIDHEERRITFYFPDIMLPDSATTGSLSEGFVEYRINAANNLSGGTEIHNTASIVFDYNDPIVTNTTLHTIFDCSNYAPTINLVENLSCDTPTVTATISESWTEQVEWQLDIEQPVSDPVFTIDTTGDHDLIVTASNPLCNTVNDTVQFNIPLPLPGLSIATSSPVICNGESVILIQLRKWKSMDF